MPNECSPSDYHNNFFFFFTIIIICHLFHIFYFFCCNRANEKRSKVAEIKSNWLWILSHVVSIECWWGVFRRAGLSFSVYSYSYIRGTLGVYRYPRVYTMGRFLELLGLTRVTYTTVPYPRLPTYPSVG